MTTKDQKQSLPFFRRKFFFFRACGEVALFLLLLGFFKPNWVVRVASMSPFADTRMLGPSAEAEDLAAQMTGNSPQAKALKEKAVSIAHSEKKQKAWLVKWISRRYRVAKSATEMFVSNAYIVGKEYRLDPILILSVAAIESRFNPIAESSVGAQGLMQVLTRVHRDKFKEYGGDVAALNPLVNMRVGAKILRQYIRAEGSVELGLKRYVGAVDHETDGGYGAKVLLEYEKLKRVASGKRVRVFAIAADVPPKPQKQTNKDGKDVKPENIPTSKAPAEKVGGAVDQEDVKTNDKLDDASVRKKVAKDALNVAEEVREKPNANIVVSVAVSDAAIKK